MKHQIVHTVQKFLLNPPIKLALAIGLPFPGYALLERMEGRRESHAARQWAMDISETSSG
jgi:hypothetical protein